MKTYIREENMKKIFITSIVSLAIGSTLMASVDTGKCAGCHGSKFDKKALGQSAIVSTMTHAAIATALKGYKNTPGFGHSPAKGVMAGQVKTYSNADLEALSKTIGK